ncbi:uncharacterized protein LOC142159960 [Mixophyes fleayi]|uniref:uncharacterized protein LOC142159960 n=1 Tax=Mixophyes fleayi TaxID=3061075 RepID=UPI003F4E1BB8
MRNRQPLTSLAGSSTRNTPERRSLPLYSQDSTEENYSISQEYQDEDLIDLKVEVIEDEEETYLTGDRQLKEEEIPTDIGTHGHNSRNTAEGHPILSPDCKIEDNKITQDSPGENPITPNIPPVHHSADISSDASNHEECSPDKSDVVTCSTSQKGNKIFPCSQCGKCFTQKGNLVIHQRTHTDERPFACSDCGKHFTQKSYLIKHQRIHTGEKPFSCSECGKDFTRKADLVKHHRIHTGEKPFTCSECGRCFTQISALIRHRRFHTGEKPFPCSECGKCFTHKSAVVKHQRIHLREKCEKPFQCSDCGKCFTQKSNVLESQRFHILEKPSSMR